MARKAKNVLFIMFDQLRWDYLSCYGHPHLKTPHIDRLASMGVRFDRAYVQSTICGSSRMCAYTGRYVHSHGVGWNNVPLKVGELTMGDHLRDIDVDCWLIGKTHMAADRAGMERFGLDPEDVIGARVSECGFDVWIRDDGLWAEGPAGPYDSRRSPYNEFLKAKGYEGSNPWHDYANSGVDDEGMMASGWFMKNARLPANISEEDSETPWLTSQAIEFIDGHRDGRPWVCHLSYIKPHWPYIVPAPYNDMYGPEHVIPAKKRNEERAGAHPVFAGFQDKLVGQSFSRDDVRETVIPAYMGLIKQCDDQMGRLFAHLEATGAMEETLIVLTSDHGDYLGDHWLGEKELFHDQSVRVPFIVYDPSEAADASRGTVCDEIVEMIDLTATFIDLQGARIPDEWVEGRSLLPLLRGETPDDWRDFAVSEYDYSATKVAKALDVAPKDARLFMIADKRWKFMHAEGGFRPMLFDLEADPDEYIDLGASPDHADIIAMMYDRLAAWARRCAQRTTMSDAQLMQMREGGPALKGVMIGVHEGDEVPLEASAKYRGAAPRQPRD